MIRLLHILLVPALAFVIGCASNTANHGQVDITDHGAVADGKTVNTQAIQAAIDACAATRGTLIVPGGVFVTGAVFLKPGVNVEFARDAVLKASPNIEDFPIIPGNRYEGHFQDWRAAVVNAQKTDHLRISGPGTIDGSGPAFWTLTTPNGRPRNCFIRDSTDVIVSGVTFKDSASWNLHFYNCREVTVENCRFEIPDDAKGPSTDGVDIDSSQNVTVRGCYFSVNDDCVCLKGNRYDGLDQNPVSPPVERVLVTDCTFTRGHGALTLGTEATDIRDVEFDHSTVKGDTPMLRLKMRPDTPGQHYQDLRVHDITLDGTGKVLSWEPSHGTRVPARPPAGVIENVVVSDIEGRYGSFGKIAGADNCRVRNITLRNMTLTLTKPQLNASRTSDVTVENVLVNGEPFTPKRD